MQSDAPPSAPEEKIVEENKFGEAQNFDFTVSYRQRLLAVVVNVLVIAELFVAMYFAAQDQDRLTPIFFKVLFSLLLPTLVFAFIAKRIIRAKAKR